jgi:hypothetical protein
MVAMIHEQGRKIKRSPAITTMEPGMGGTGFGYYEELMMKGVIYRK